MTGKSLADLPNGVISSIASHIPTIQEAYELKRSCKRLYSTVNRLLVFDSLAQLYEIFYIAYDQDEEPIGALKPVLLTLKDEFHSVPIETLKSTLSITEDNERMHLECPPELNWSVALAIAGKCDWKSIITKIIYEDSSFETYFMALRFSVIGTSAEIVKELLKINPGILKRDFRDCWEELGATEDNWKVYEKYRYYFYQGDILGYLVKISELHGNYRAKKYLLSNSSRSANLGGRVSDSDEEVDGGSDDPDGAEEQVPLIFPKPARREIKDIDTAIKLDSLKSYKKMLEKNSRSANELLCDLNLASKNGAIKIVRYLVEEKNLDFHHNRDDAFRWACEYSHFEIVSYFIHCGTDIRPYSHVAMKYAAQSGFFKFFTSMDRRGVDYNKCDCFLDACLNGRTAIVDFLLSSYREFFDQSLLDEGLRMAADTHQEKTMRYLIAQGADKNSYDGLILDRHPI
ncbi:hypothetical protein BJ742DRAFT_824561 [Cladochytrium replicatum]|nr:hypothetical protein BJ742DRAFT_824561 [Cladochytrium replicatum]